MSYDTTRDIEFEKIVLVNVGSLLGPVKAEFVNGTLFVETNSIGATVLMNHFADIYRPEQLGLNYIGNEIAIDFQ